MIFVCVGSREYQFNRLLKEIDSLIEKQIIDQDVFAQIGQSDYIPKNYQFQRFLSSEKFIKLQKEATMIISHAGTGALMGALKLGKNTIAVPRLAKFGEHIDNHQLQISELLESQGYLKSVTNINELGKTINQYDHNLEVKKYDKESMVLDLIIDYINNN